VIAAAMLGEPASGGQAARLLAADWEFTAPAHWKAELCNVVWKAVLLHRLAAEEAATILSRAGYLPIESVDVGELWRGALMRAISAGHPAYDTLFVELAIRLRTKVASFDQRLQRKFPSIVRTPSDLLTR
jgi:predicted nucleic acid-binding protein